MPIHFAIDAGQIDSIGAIGTFRHGLLAGQHALRMMRKLCANDLYSLSKKLAIALGPRVGGRMSRPLYPRTKVVTTVTVYTPALYKC